MAETRHAPPRARNRLLAKIGNPPKLPPHAASLRGEGGNFRRLILHPANNSIGFQISNYISSIFPSLAYAYWWEQRGSFLFSRRSPPPSLDKMARKDILLCSVDFPSILERRREPGAGEGEGRGGGSFHYPPTTCRRRRRRRMSPPQYKNYTVDPPRAELCALFLLPPAGAKRDGIRKGRGEIIR